MIDTVLFDLGNTLAAYFESRHFDAVLEESLVGVAQHLDARGLLRLSAEEARHAARGEDRERDDHRVRPLAGRLGRIFGLAEEDLAGGLGAELCRRFMAPVSARARRYDDTLPTLERLRERGFRIAIVSNAPWGAPADLCREEADRLDLTGRVDAVIFCTEVGWRKPSPRIFAHALGRLGARPEQCLFVGDHPVWDVEGPRAAGMTAVLLDRDGVRPPTGEAPLRGLGELWGRLGG
ncbi:MAG: HAD family hydrolase [Deferrisomatales bacterium]